MRTEAIHKSQEPVWDSLLDLEHGEHVNIDPANSFIFIELWDADYLMDEKICHAAMLLADGLLQQGNV